MSQPRPTLLSIQVGRPRTMGEDGAADPLDRPWTSGIFKERVEGPIRLGWTNLEGDGQADSRHHGGREKAVLACAARHYDAWRVELDRPELAFGSFGENFTIDGLDETTVCIGDTYEVGGARVQVAQPRQPCWKLAHRFGIKDMPAHVQQTNRAGWYFRVLEPGTVEAGQSCDLVERPCPGWTVALANDLIYRRLHDQTLLAALADCPLLAPSWRESLAKRRDGIPESDPRKRLIGPNAEPQAHPQSPITAA